ncbi:M14 family metallopeptidase [Pedobacter flavus]|uniref:M14 family metallopeptidase n=1 Tax=Pedobacter flavus TaxID=3113906 RepID=A0ABU7GZP4_9SPHI|nr:M14 family metallopeptidase [Pedobacter sp. VNH31]MEE1884487.1 M14 family metallopeptidase [Pedobacter sp. VNH31]
MKIHNLATGVLMMLCGSVWAQNQQDYSSNARLSERISALTKAYPNLATAKTLIETEGGNKVWMLTLGTGKTSEKQAIAVVGGVEGTHLLGVEMAIGFAEQLLASKVDSVKKLLDKHTFYVFPNMSPDATAQYFAKLKFERSGNARPTDDDRDGKMNEDGFEDLNGDNKISWIRVVDPTGKYKLNPDDARTLVLADPTKGDTGKYLLFREGIDNDKDGSFNEDGEGGIHFNKNFSYNYKNFGPGAGEYAVSEKENRALLDEMFELFNVYAVVTFGPMNNLSTPVTFNPSALSKRIITGWYDADVKANALVSERYNKITGYKDAPRTQAENGDFSQWAYFHYGRLSLSTPGWWVPKVKPDAEKNEKAFTNDNLGAAYLRWAASNNIQGTFVEWKKVNHPDFPGQEVEVGGIDPFVMNNPPYSMVNDIVSKHTNFMVELANMAPKIDLVALKTEKVGEGLTRVTVKVMNAGTLPTLSKVGERSYFLKKVAVKATVSNNQTIISGKKAETLDGIPGKGYVELSWLVRGSGKFAIQAGSPSSGSKSIEVNL